MRVPPGSQSSNPATRDRGQFVAEDEGQRGLPQARRAAQENVIQRLAAEAGFVLGFIPGFASVSLPFHFRSEIAQVFHETRMRALDDVRVFHHAAPRDAGGDHVKRDGHADHVGRIDPAACSFISFDIQLVSAEKTSRFEE